MRRAMLQIECNTQAAALIAEGSQCVADTASLPARRSAPTFVYPCM